MQSTIVKAIKLSKPDVESFTSVAKASLRLSPPEIPFRFKSGAPITNIIFNFLLQKIETTKRFQYANILFHPTFDFLIRIKRKLYEFLSEKNQLKKSFEIDTKEKFTFILSDNFSILILWNLFPYPFLWTCFTIFMAL
ncbi:hypothetical protein BpHYR1_011666 [Brachionus plicatilis]|uniref:Uncharacterized protein n=1 Tax=Brachionus plicatilis TaxID=10195 RepID=A0A3M7RSH1_BRAPC|nr:hypothetical protein BpHYR1_011666 [Brachionus plicatilis]